MNFIKKIKLWYINRRMKHFYHNIVIKCLSNNNFDENNTLYFVDRIMKFMFPNNYKDDYWKL